MGAMTRILGGVKMEMTRRVIGRGCLILLLLVTWAGCDFGPMAHEYSGDNLDSEAEWDTFDDTIAPIQEFDVDTGLNEVREADTFGEVDWEQIAEDYSSENPELQFGLCREGEFTCERYVCEFLERRVFEEASLNYPDMCEDADWSCDKCYWKLFECLTEEAAMCDQVEGLAIYKVKPRFEECYMEVTGFDRCRWFLPDVCEGIDECSGPEWPIL